MLYWYNWFSWWWARGCSKHVENWNKHIEMNFASSWPFSKYFDMSTVVTLIINAQNFGREMARSLLLLYFLLFIKGHWSNYNFVVGQGNVISEELTEKDSEGNGLGLVEVQPRHLPWGNEKNRWKKNRAGYLTTRLRSESGTSQIKFLTVTDSPSLPVQCC